MRPSTPQSCISDRRAYRPAPGRRKRSSAAWCAWRREEVLDAEAFGVLPDERERRVGHIAAWHRSPPGTPRATSPAAPRPAGRRRRRCRRPSVRGWEPTGVGAVFRIQLKRARDDPRVAEVVAHQPLDALLRKRARVPEDVGGLFLQRVAELVRGCACVSRCRIERIRSRKSSASSSRARSSGPRRRSDGSVSAAIQRDRRQVAQRAGRFLDVRLELIERRVEQRVALVDERVQRADDVRVGAGVVERGFEAVDRARGRRRPAARRPAP